jgi:nicotinamide riboside kinase
VASPGLIAIVGGESTGKSTLAAALAAELPAIVVPEALRTWVTEHARVPTAAEQQDVVELHTRLERAALAEAAGRGVPWVASDAGPLMTAVYSILYYDDDSLVTEAVRLSGGTRLVVWCDDDIPWVPDADQRDGVHMRAAAQRIIGQLLIDSGLAWLKVTGDLPTRVAAVRAQLRGAGGARAESQSVGRRERSQ